MKDLIPKVKKNETGKLKMIAGDMIINIIATIIPIFILQFVLLPLVANSYDEYHYGLMLTLISLITVSVQSFSVSLSNSRLLLDEQYKAEGLSGDFNILMIVYSVMNIFIVVIGTFLYEGKFTLINISLIIIFSVIQLIRRYLLVAYRLEINYKGILYSNIILIIGYLFGMLLFFIFEGWQLIYILGEIFSLIYVLKNTTLIKEPFKTTRLFASTTKHGLIILAASFLGTATTNIDRLLLYPMLGARMVTIYYVSTLFGKTISMLVGPINNVILTYISKMKKFEVDTFKLLLTTASILGLFSYIIIILVSEPILKFLYPLYFDNAMKLIYITTLTAIVIMLCTVINPIVMKFCNIKWQIGISSINIIVYFVFAFYLVDLFGIYGFCVAALIASIVNLILLILVYYSNQKKLSRKFDINIE